MCFLAPNIDSTNIGQEAGPRIVSTTNVFTTGLALVSVGSSPPMWKRTFHVTLGVVGGIMWGTAPFLVITTRQDPMFLHWLSQFLQR